MSFFDAKDDVLITCRTTNLGPFTASDSCLYEHDLVNLLNSYQSFANLWYQIDYLQKKKKDKISLVRTN